MTGQTSFEERLKKLEAKNGHVPSPAMATGQTMADGDMSALRNPGPTTGSRGGGALGKAVFSVVLVLFVMMAGLAAYTYQQTNGFASYAVNETAAAINNAPRTEQEPGIIAKLIGGPLAPDGFTTPDEKPVGNLPTPGEGWMRITQDDAARPGIADEIRANWPTDAIPLRDHPGYDNLNRFLKTYKVHDMEMKVLSKKRARAMYMHPDGEFMWVMLEFLDEVRALGPENKPYFWISELTERMEKKLRGDQILGGAIIKPYAALSITRKSRSRELERAAKGDGKTPVQMQLTIPLNHRTLVNFQGNMGPAWVTAFIASMPDRNYQGLVD